MTPAKLIQLEHLNFLRQALELARLSPPRPTNFCVGALLVNEETLKVLSTGYTHECEGNTHAEQCCFIKLSEQYGVSEDSLGAFLPKQTVLYTTLEPCSLRLSGAMSCVDRILERKYPIKAVYVGLIEPETFVGENNGRHKLESAGVKVIYVPGLESDILAVATAGHS
ncbi:hypothetical protein K3495_g2331 [Podosphaera aphanis]|nr:hypothetical protein K3495_g2331 [Podosphaera aphanis]